MLQVQRVRNVALPSTKQFSSGSGRRLLRVQLSDGRLSLSGVEMEGAIAGLRSLPSISYSPSSRVSVGNLGSFMEKNRKEKKSVFIPPFPFISSVG